MIDTVIIFSNEEIFTIFSHGMVGGLFVGSFCFVIGFVIDFLLSLVGNEVN